MNNKNQSRQKIIYTLIALSLPVLFLFQNCNKVNLQSLTAPDSLVNLKTGTAEICLPADYTLDTFFVTNLNAKTTRYGLYTDTDGDGLSDAEEAVLGSNPYNRRSGGFVLDSICKNVDYGPLCANFNLQCDQTENAMGINECDMFALQITKPKSLGGGIDSDKDAIPDFLEVKYNSFANIDDSLSDLDLDQVNTISEAEQGTSAEEDNAAIQTNYITSMTKTRLTSDRCNGEFWSVEVKNLPTIVSDDFTDIPDNVVAGYSDRFSHSRNENIIQVTMKIKNIVDPSAPSKTYTSYKKAQIDIANTVKQINLNFIQNDTFSGDVER